MRKQTVLHFKRVDVLPAADDQVLDTARDADIAIVIHGGLITRVHPQLTLVVSSHHLGGLLRLAPVLLHHQVAAHRQLAPFPDAENSRGVDWVHDLGFHMWHQPPHGVDALVHGVICRRHARHWARLRHAVADGQLGQVERLVQLAHDLGRD